LTHTNTHTHTHTYTHTGSMVVDNAVFGGDRRVSDMVVSKLHANAHTHTHMPAAAYVDAQT
jgi:hypothetical protein